jgi:hypothetical protein
MWTVTTTGDLPDDHETLGHDAPLAAWSDYHGRILELEIYGFVRDAEEALQYGRRWACTLTRGIEQISVTIERLVPVLSKGPAGLRQTSPGRWVDAELLEQVAVLFVVDLVGQLLGGFLVVAAALSDLFENRVFVELHGCSS